MIRWLKRLFGGKETIEEALQKRGLGLHSHADAIRHCVEQIEQYMALAENPKLSQGRREQLAHLIDVRGARLRKFGVQPPRTPQDCCAMLDELNGD